MLHVILSRSQFAGSGPGAQTKEGGGRGDTSLPYFGVGIVNVNRPPRNVPKYGIFMENVLVNQ